MKTLTSFLIALCFFVTACAAATVSTTTVRTLEDYPRATNVANSTNVLFYTTVNGNTRAMSDTTLAELLGKTLDGYTRATNVANSTNVLFYTTVNGNTRAMSDTTLAELLGKTGRGHGASNVIYVAYRSDGVDGTGTQQSPRDASSGYKLQQILTNLPANTTVFFYPSTNYVWPLKVGSGTTWNVPWLPKSGQSFIGLGGMNSVKVTADTNMNAYAIGHVAKNAFFYNNGYLSNVTIQGIHFELNGEYYIRNFCTNGSDAVKAAHMAESLYGEDMLIDGCRLTGQWGGWTDFGSGPIQNDSECFPIALGAAFPQIQTGFVLTRVYKGNTIRNCEIISTNEMYTPWGYGGQVLAGSPSGFGADFEQIYNSNKWAIPYYVFENNRLYSASNAAPLTPIDGIRAIIRNNVIVNGGAYYFDTWAINDVEYSGNVVTQNQPATGPLFGVNMQTNGPSGFERASNVRILNNIFTRTSPEKDQGGGTDFLMRIYGGTNPHTGAMMGVSNWVIRGNTFIGPEPRCYDRMYLWLTNNPKNGDTITFNGTDVRTFVTSALNSNQVTIGGSYLTTLTNLYISLTNNAPYGTLGSPYPSFFNGGNYLQINQDSFVNNKNFTATLAPSTNGYFITNTPLYLPVIGGIFSQGTVNSVIENNEFKNISTAFYGNNVTSNLLFKNNRLINNSFGVYLEDGRAGMPNGVTVSDNIFNNNAFAIFRGNSDNLKIQNNTVFDHSTFYVANGIDLRTYEPYSTQPISILTNSGPVPWNRKSTNVIITGNIFKQVSVTNKNAYYYASIGGVSGLTIADNYDDTLYGVAMGRHNGIETVDNVRMRGFSVGSEWGQATNLTVATALYVTNASGAAIIYTNGVPLTAGGTLTSTNSTLRFLGYTVVGGTNTMAIATGTNGTEKVQYVPLLQ